MPEYEVYYLPLSREDMPAGIGWLSPREAQVHENFSFPKRRNDWLLGRWTAKQALLRLEHDSQGDPARWEILADGSGAPVAHRNGEPVPIQLTLSHSDGRCLCAVSRASIRLGCDLERVESRSPAFEETYFLPEEIEMLDSFPKTRRAFGVTLIWSAKESVLKALRIGLSADTRRARIIQIQDSDSAHWRSFSAVDAVDEASFNGWWKEQAGMIMTIVADASAKNPIQV